MFKSKSKEAGYSSANAQSLKSNFKIREPREIEYGKETLYTDQEIIRHYQVMAYRDSGTLKASGTHKVALLIELIVDAMDAIIGKSTDFTNATATAEQVMYNLGRLMRQKYEGDRLVEELEGGTLVVELARLATGVAASTATNANCVCQCWFFIGKLTDDFFGTWNTTEFKHEDYAWAGIWAAVLYLLRLWSWQLGTYNRLIQSTGEFTTKNGFIEGKVRQFSKLDPSSWGCALLERDNGELDLFGLSEGMIDDATYRGIKVPISVGFETSMNRLFSSTKWTWRYGRTIEVIPVYTLFSVVAPNADSIDQADLDTTAHGMQLFNTYTNVDWKWVNTQLCDIVTRLQGFYFKGSNGKNFSALKQKIKLVDFFDVPIPGEGQGGLLCFQMTYFNVEVDQDDMNNKTNHDTSNSREAALQTRRTDIVDYNFQVIGDVPLEDYLFYIGLTIDQTLIDADKAAGSPTNMDYPAMIISPITSVAFALSKNEFEDYKLWPSIIDVCTGELESAGVNTVQQKLWVYPTSYPSTKYEFPVGIEFNAGVFFEGRAGDPFKKLKHTTYDANNLDVDKIHQIVFEGLIDVKGGSKDDFIPASAGLEEDKFEPESKEEEEKKEEQPVSAKEQPVSAKVEEDPKKKKEEHKKKMEEQAAAKKKKDEEEKKKKEKQSKGGKQ